MDVPARRRAGNVRLLTFENRGGFFERLAAFQDLHDSRIAGIGQRVGAEVGRHKNRIGVDPLQFSFGLGPKESTALGRDEGALFDVELARHGSVAAAARQFDEATLVIGIAAGPTFPHPVLAFGLGERIDVEDRFPSRRRLTIFVEAGAAHDAALVFGIAPEVVVPGADLFDRGYAFVRVVDREQAIVERRISGRCVELFARADILLVDPAERVGAIDVFEPAVGVIVRGCVGHRCRGCCHRRRCHGGQKNRKQKFRDHLVTSGIVVVEGRRSLAPGMPRKAALKSVSFGARGTM